MRFITGISLVGVGWNTVIGTFDNSRKHKDSRQAVSQVLKRTRSNGDSPSIEVRKENRSVVYSVS